MTNWKVPLADLDLGREEIEAVTDVLRSRWLSMGPITAEFERYFADYIGVKYAFAVTNCTAALHLAHLALGAGPGDTVICPSLTFVATANAVRYTGATPVFADITSVDNLNISPDDLEAKIDATTKGICVVHYGGYPCDMERILRIAERHDLYVVEDAAHAVGAACWVPADLTPGRQSDGESILRKCGNIGDIGCFSFFSNKNMTTGEGGMLTTNRDDIAKKIQLVRSHGMTSLTWDRDKGHSFSYDVVDLGFNYRIDEIRSAVGFVQIKKLDNNNHKREEATHFYKENLCEIEEITLPSFGDERSISSHHIFPVLLNERNKRENFMTFLRDNGIQTSIHYPPIHTFTDYKSSMQHSNLSLTEDAASKEVTLPLYAGMTREQLDYVVKVVKEWAISVK